MHAALNSVSLPRANISISMRDKWVGNILALFTNIFRVGHPTAAAVYKSVFSSFCRRLRPAGCQCLCQFEVSGVISLSLSLSLSLSRAEGHMHHPQRDKTPLIISLGRRQEEEETARERERGREREWERALGMEMWLAEPMLIQTPIHNAEVKAAVCMTIVC
jgi:hypothetical protein